MSNKILHAAALISKAQIHQSITGSTESKPSAVRQSTLIAVCIFLACVMASGCSSRVTGPQTQTRDVDGMLVQAAIRPGLPQDAAAAASGADAQTGDNTLTVTLRDDKTNAVIPDANVSAAPTNTLVGQQRTESGRSQGNGVYLVPIRFAVADTYTVLVTIDRTAKPESSAQFLFTAN
jgi:hypothetical protein